MEKKYSTINHIFTTEAMKTILSYPWPGNVRELENYIERLVVTVKEIYIDTCHLSSLLSDTNFAQMAADTLAIDSFDDYIESVEKAIIKAAYEKHGSSRKVAKALGLSDNKALRLIRKYCYS